MSARELMSRGALSPDGRFMPIPLPAVCQLRAGLRQNRKSDYLSVVIHAFDHCIVSCLAHITGPLGKSDFQKVTLTVVPDFHFIGHTCFPFFGLSVR